MTHLTALALVAVILCSLPEPSSHKGSENEKNINIFICANDFNEHM